MIDPGELVELDEDHWYFDDMERPTPRSIIEHAQLILECDISHPIILDQEGRVLDGMHRVCKAALEGVARFPAVQFIQDPAPDFVDCDPTKLPYWDSDS